MGVAMVLELPRGVLEAPGASYGLRADSGVRHPGAPSSQPARSARALVCLGRDFSLCARLVGLLCRGSGALII